MINERNGNNGTRFCVFAQKLLNECLKCNYAPLDPLEIQKDFLIGARESTKTNQCLLRKQIITQKSFHANVGFLNLTI